MKRAFLFFIIIISAIFITAGRSDLRHMPDAKPVVSAGKDSMAAANGGTALYWHNGAFSLFSGAASNIAYDTISGYVQVAAAAAYGAGDEYSLTYWASGDNGANWTTGVDLFPSMHSESHSLSCFTISEDGYPYAYATWRTASTRGAFFISDPSGPNAGGWTSPVLIGDTVSYTSNDYATLTTNPVGNKVAFLGWNDYWSFASNVSSDYGVSWGTYTDIPQVNPDSNPDIYITDISTIRWADGDNVYGLIGFTPTVDSMAYIAGQGTTFGLVKSTDGGDTYGSMLPLFSGTWWPNVDGMGTDSFTYMMDTVDNEYAGDAFEVQAWYDPTQGIFVDELGNIDGMGIAPGTWWHKWDMEYVGGKLHIIAPFQMVTVDYITEGDLYTFTDYWDNMMYGVMDIAGGDTEFTWTFCDVKCEVIDTLGNTDTYRGYQGSAQICYDWRNDNTYIVYMDLYDTATAAGSHEILKIEPNGNVWRAPYPPIVNSNVYNAIQAANIVDENGVIHQIWRTESADSIYYAGIDVDNWNEWGINERPETIINSNKTDEFYTLEKVSSGQSVISFTLKKSAYIEIGLFDISGREVQSVCSQRFEPGHYSLDIDSSELPSGVYYTLINKDGAVNRDKIIIMK